MLPCTSFASWRIQNADPKDLEEIVYVALGFMRIEDRISAAKYWKVGSVRESDGQRLTASHFRMLGPNETADGMILSREVIYLPVLPFW